MYLQGAAPSEEVSEEEFFLVSTNSQEPHTSFSLWQQHCHLCHKLFSFLFVFSYRDTSNVGLRVYTMATSPHLNMGIAFSSILFHIHRDQGLRCQCI